MVWFVKDSTEIIWQIAKYSGLNMEANFALDSSWSNANRVSNHPKKMNFVVKLKWLHTIFPNLIRDRCTSGLISSILLNGNVSILLDQCYPQFNLNIILLNLWWYLFFFFFFFWMIVRVCGWVNVQKVGEKFVCIFKVWHWNIWWKYNQSSMSSNFLIWEALLFKQISEEQRDLYPFPGELFSYQYQVW